MGWKGLQVLEGKVLEPALRRGRGKEPEPVRVSVLVLQWEREPEPVLGAWLLLRESGQE